MSSKNLEITISGYAGSGKSHLAAYLSKVLSDNGFNVDVEDIDIDTNQSVDFGNPDVVNMIAEHTTIKLNTHQKPR